ncbi:Extradiol ring-cleavage dioxygenase, class III enzyme, subunit B [Mycotypha africana]|uniref:Extradiol ring-cleavage dioxygenase, class III enzyme, subunit B n=1 Tax=Mycotypha africana TaxID=64632 RepID=UPI0023001020|nr:Extradiol ring-cleavage dioxygenase, class III enzyme, subunit B [Mycotypha africana]KAI8968310.1 Extradiol ring-cleavage dioxygenase, class III enzyme, subunit B [Mycotypha africana]
MRFDSHIGKTDYCNREEGIVIIGSGSAVHNLRTLWQHADSPSPPFVALFDNEMTKVATNFTAEERNEKACRLNQHQAFRLCHPTAEHLVPFHVALGAAGNDQGKKLLEDYFSTLSWSSFGFGLPDDIELPNYP